MSRFQSCPVCGQKYLFYITNLSTVRTARYLPLYACLWCNSFSNPSGYIESDRVLQLDLEWHKSVADRNAKASKHLLAEFRHLGMPLSKIVEIGAGTGTFLRVAKDEGIAGLGFEVNPFTQPYALQENDVDVRAELWSKDTDVGEFDLLLSLMVLEHIPEPRPLIKEMVEASLASKAHLYISVPFVDREHWKFLHIDDPKAEGSPFFDQDVHVTHFSPKGMEMVLTEFGMTELRWIRSGMWHGVLANGPDVQRKNPSQ